MEKIENINSFIINYQLNMSPPIGERSRCASGVCECDMRRLSLIQLVEKHQNLHQCLSNLTGERRANCLVVSRLIERLDEIENLCHSIAAGIIDMDNEDQAALIERKHQCIEQLSNQREAVVLSEAGIAFLSYQMDWVMFHIHLTWEEEQRRYYEELWRLNQGF